MDTIDEINKDNIDLLDGTTKATEGNENSSVWKEVIDTGNICSKDGFEKI